MTSQLIKTSPLFLLNFLFSCIDHQDTATDTQQLIQEQIAAHYNSLQLEGYQPLSFSNIDTTAIQRNKDGSISVIIGEVTHRYRALQHDSLQEQSQVFDVQVYEDDVVVIPKKDDTAQDEQSSIRI